jgi:hypothetical protein
VSNLIITAEKQHEAELIEVNSINLLAHWHTGSLADFVSAVLQNIVFR